MREGSLIKRNTGIDELRIIAMFFVVILHFLGHGGVLDSVFEGTGSYYASWILEIIALPAVDIFALITGYVSFGKGNNLHKTYSRYISIWLEVVFYGFIIAVFSFLLDHNNFQTIDLIKPLVPVSGGMYWYFTAYTGMMLIAPLLNLGIQNLNERQLKTILYLLVIWFSVLDTFVDRFNLNRGYSTIWLSLLFVIGAIIKKTNLGKGLTRRSCFIGILLLYLINILFKFSNIGVHKGFFIIGTDTLISYTSPTVLGIAGLYLIMFSVIEHSATYKRVIAFLAPGAFAVYLLNDNYLLRGAFIEGRFASIANYRYLMLISIIICSAMAFTLIALVIDKGRQKLFSTIRISEKSEKLVFTLAKLIER